MGDIRPNAMDSASSGLTAISNLINCTSSCLKKERSNDQDSVACPKSRLQPLAKKHEARTTCVNHQTAPLIQSTTVRPRRRVILVSFHVLQTEPVETPSTLHTVFGGILHKY